MLFSHSSFRHVPMCSSVTLDAMLVCLPGPSSRIDTARSPSLVARRTTRVWVSMATTTEKLAQSNVRNASTSVTINVPVNVASLARRNSVQDRPSPETQANRFELPSTARLVAMEDVRFVREQLEHVDALQALLEVRQLHARLDQELHAVARLTRAIHGAAALHWSNVYPHGHKLRHVSVGVARTTGAGEKWGLVAQLLQMLHEVICVPPCVEHDTDVEVGRRKLEVVAAGAKH